MSIMWRDCLMRLIVILPSKLQNKRQFHLLVEALIMEGILDKDDVNYVMGIK